MYSGPFISIIIYSKMGTGTGAGTKSSPVCAGPNSVNNESSLNTLVQNRACKFQKYYWILLDIIMLHTEKEIAYHIFSESYIAKLAVKLPKQQIAWKDWKTINKSSSFKGIERCNFSDLTCSQSEAKEYLLCIISYANHLNSSCIDASM